MKFKWDHKYLYWGITAFLVIVLSISFFILIYNYRDIVTVLTKIVSILMPFIIGLSIAYLLCPIMNFFERKVFLPLLKRLKLKKIDRSPRIIALISTLIVAAALLLSLFYMVIPQLVESINGIVGNLETYFNNFESWAASVVASNPMLQSILTDEFSDIGSVIMDWAKNNLFPQVNSILSNVTSGVIDAFVGIKNIFIGVIISVYTLYSKEKFGAQAKKLIYSMLPSKGANTIVSITHRSHRVFGRFIVGKLIDSLIISMLCFVGMSIINLPFSLLISVIIGVTNIIPFFGPLIGAIPCALLILLVDPLGCLYFVIFILLLQQFDGNILGPMILGDSTGLSAFWVIFAILLSGGLFGFLGMVVGVPAFSIIYSLIVELVEARLSRKKLPLDTASYANLIKLDDQHCEYLKEDTAPRKH